MVHTKEFINPLYGNEEIEKDTFRYRTNKDLKAYQKTRILNNRDFDTNNNNNNNNNTKKKDRRHTVRGTANIKKRTNNNNNKNRIRNSKIALNENNSINKKHTKQTRRGSSNTKKQKQRRTSAPDILNSSHTRTFKDEAKYKLKKVKQKNKKRYKR